MAASLTQLLNALPEPLCSKYELTKLLAAGAYALVYQIQNRKTMKKYALKVVEKRPLEMRALIPQLWREADILSECRNMPHVVQLLDTHQTSTHVFLRFELCKASLEDMCKQDGPMGEKEALRWMRQACLGTQELHANGIVHRDLKPSNFLADKEGNLCICDFGFVCREQDGLSGIAGSPNYSAPEATKENGSVHTTKVDIYSLGSSLQHLLLGRAPNGPQDLPEGLSAETKLLLEEMLDRDPNDRPTIDELLEMPGFAEENILTKFFGGMQVLLGGIPGA
jgi:serine/threonine protein kinase